MNMAFNDRRYTSAFAPHGYECLLVDEDCLSEADCREVIFDNVVHPRDWNCHVTQRERETLEEKLKAIEKSRSPYIYYPAGESAGQLDARAELARRGTFRAFAREKYGNGHGVWYGDRPPWLQNSS
jgi:hypothetical protein